MDCGCFTPPNRCASDSTGIARVLRPGSIENSLPKYSPMRGRPSAIVAGRKSVHAAAAMNSRMIAAKVSSVSVWRARRSAPKRCWNSR